MAFPAVFAAVGRSAVGRGAAMRGARGLRGGTGPTVSVSIDSTQAIRAIKQIEADLAGIRGVLSAGINPNRRYYRGRKRPVSIAQVAAWHEYGTRHMPARPAMRALMAAKGGAYQAEMARRLAKALRAKNAARSSRSAMLRMGQRIVNDIRQAILKYSGAPLDESTRRKKAAAGRSSRPLVATGRLANAYEAVWVRDPRKRVGGFREWIRASRKIHGNVVRSK